MPQITNLTSGNQEDLVGRMPSGTSRSSLILCQSAAQAIQELPPGTGRASEILYRTAIRTARGLYLGSPGDLFFVQNFNEVARENILSTLAEIYSLLTWPDGWNGYDASAPKYEAVQYAAHWIELFYMEVMDVNQGWLEPNVTASAEREIVFEWRKGIKGLTIYVGNQSAEYVTDWGADINTEMEDGFANSPSIRRALWKWLMS
jgi:hypothetical protein